MIFYLLMLWIPSTLIGLLLSLLILIKASRGAQATHRWHPDDPIETLIAESAQRREAAKVFVHTALASVGWIVLGARYDVVDEPWTLFWPVLLTSATLALTISTIVTYFDDRRLQRRIREERARIEAEGSVQEEESYG